MSERTWVSPLQFKVVGNFLEIINKTNTFRFNDMVKGNPRNKYCFIPVSRCSDVWYENIKSDHTINYDVVTPLYYKVEGEDPVALEYESVEFLAEDTDSKGIVVSVLEQTPLLSIGDVVQEFKGCFIINQVTGAVIAYCILPETVDVTEYLIFSYQGYLLEINNDVLPVDELVIEDVPDEPEVIVVPASISLTVDNDTIMSGETATLTATVLDGDGEPCEGVGVSFSSDIMNTVYSNITNNQGMVTYSYDSEGVGDFTVTASANGLSDSVLIQDCFFQDSMMENSGKWSVPSGVSLSYSDKGATLTATLYNSLVSVGSWTAQPVTLEFTVHQVTNNKEAQPIAMIANGSGLPLLGINVKNSEWTIMRNNTTTSSTSNYLKVNSISLQQGDIIRLKQTSTNYIVEVERNGEVITISDTEWTYGASTFNVRFDTGANRSLTFRDVKLKPLME